MENLTCCEWCLDGGIMQKYHDEEWGFPLHDDRRHFEYLTMEVMQCGLSWLLMLKKRDAFRKSFAEWDFEKVARFEEQDIENALAVENMIKSRRKIEAVISNARHFLEIIGEYGSFDNYIWSFTGGKTVIYKNRLYGGEWQAKSELSEKISGDLKRRGFKYLGSVVMYSHLQAAGIINDHKKECWKWKKCRAANAWVEM